MRNFFLPLCFIAHFLGAQHDSIFNSYFQNPNAPGVTVAVGKGDSIIFKKSFGLSNLENGEKVNESTMFEIASNSKQFTCFALMLLEQEGKISWEDDVRKYIPELPFYGDTIKLKHCAQHTSGIKDYVGLIHLSGLRQDSVVTFEKTLNLIFNLSEVNSKPGERFEYSNSGYALLAEVINRVTKEGYVEYLKNYVFKAANLQSATIRKELKPIKNEATPYHFPSTAVKESRNFSQAYGACSILMNINDAIKWMQFMMDPPKKYKPIIEKMTSKEGLIFHYGYGLFLNEYKGHEVIAHDGSWYGFMSVFRYFPKDSVFTVIMNNGNYENKMWEWTEAATDAIMGLETKHSGWFNPITNSNIIEKINPEDLQKYEGEFIFRRGGYVKSFIKNNQLFAIDPWGDEYPMYHLGNNVFRWGPEVVKYKFKKGRVKHISAKVGPLKIKANPYNPYKTYGVKSSDLIGSYYNKDLKVTYEVKLEDCKLVIYHKSHGARHIKQRKKLTFNVGKWWMYEIHFIKEKGEITGFKMTGIARDYGELTFEKQ